MYRKNAALRRNPRKLARFLDAARAARDKAAGRVDSATEEYDAQREALEKEGNRGGSA